MSEQGIERVTVCVDKRCSKESAHSQGSPGCFFAPPIPAGEVGELVAWLRHIAITRGLYPVEQHKAETAAALLERYAAASSLVTVNRKVIGGRDE